MATLFQHRHYVAVAKTLASTLNDTHIHAWCETASALAQMFQDDNPRFDRDRFFKAARGEPGVRDKR